MTKTKKRPVATKPIDIAADDLPGLLTPEIYRQIAARWGAPTVAEFNDGIRRLFACGLIQAASDGRIRLIPE